MADLGAVLASILPRKRRSDAGGPGIIRRDAGGDDGG